MRGPSRWRTARSSKVNLTHAINCRASCGANLVTYPAEFRGIKPVELHRFDTASEQRGNKLQRFQDSLSPGGLGRDFFLFFITLEPRVE